MQPLGWQLGRNLLEGSLGASEELREHAIEAIEVPFIFDQRRTRQVVELLG